MLHSSYLHGDDADDDFASLSSLYGSGGGAGGGHHGSGVGVSGGSYASPYGGASASSLMTGASLLSPSPKPSGLGLSSMGPARVDSPFYFGQHTQQEFLPPLPPSTPSQGVSASVHHHSHTHTHNHFHHHVTTSSPQMSSNLTSFHPSNRFDCMSPPPGALFTPPSKNAAASGRPSSTSTAGHQILTTPQQPHFGASGRSTPSSSGSDDSGSGLLPPLPAPTPTRPTSHAQVLASADGDKDPDSLMVDSLDTPPLCSRSCTPDSSVAGSTSSRMAHTHEVAATRGSGKGVRPVKYEVHEKHDLKNQQHFAQDASGDHDHEMEEHEIINPEEKIREEREEREEEDQITRSVGVVASHRGEDPASFSSTRAEIQPQLALLPSPLDTSRSDSAHSGSTTDDSPVHTPRYGAGKYGPGHATGGKYSQYSSPALSPRFPSPVMPSQNGGGSSPTAHAHTRLTDPHSTSGVVDVGNHRQVHHGRLTRASASASHHHSASGVGGMMAPLPSPGLPGLYGTAASGGASSPISPLPSLYGSHSHPQQSHSHRYAHDPAMQTIVHGPNSPYVNADGSPRKPAKPRAGRTPMSEYPIGTLVTIRPEAYHSQKVRAKLAGFFGKTVRISCLPIYPDTWFGISLNGKEVKVRSSAFYRPEKDGILPENPPNGSGSGSGSGGSSKGGSSATATTPSAASNGGDSGNDANGGQSPANGDGSSAAAVSSFGKTKKRKRSDDHHVGGGAASNGGASQPQSLLLNNESADQEIELPASPSEYNPYKGGVCSYHCVCNSAHSSKRIFNRHQAQCALWHKFVERHNMSCELATEYYQDERTSEDLAYAAASAASASTFPSARSHSHSHSHSSDNGMSHSSSAAGESTAERYSKRARVDGSASVAVAPMMYNGGIPTPAAGLRFPGTTSAAASPAAAASGSSYPSMHQHHSAAASSAFVNAFHNPAFNPYLAAHQSAAAMAGAAAFGVGGVPLPPFAMTPAQRNATFAAHMNGMAAAAQAAAAAGGQMFPTPAAAARTSPFPHPIAAMSHVSVNSGTSPHMYSSQMFSSVATSADSISSVKSQPRAGNGVDHAAAAREMATRQAPSHFAAKHAAATASGQELPTSSSAVSGVTKPVSTAIPSSQTAFHAPPVAYTAPALQSSHSSLSTPPMTAIKPEHTMPLAVPRSQPQLARSVSAAASGPPPPAPVQPQHQPPHPPAPPAQGCPPPPPPPASMLPPNLVNGRYRRGGA